MRLRASGDELKQFKNGNPEIQKKVLDTTIEYYYKQLVGAKGDDVRLYQGYIQSLISIREVYN